ncbi:hypothetical protein HDE_02179 [Halotydeus destructor]|nr:hypothetical protein HDE_02179 [Halotydeus destructor]
MPQTGRSRHGQCCQNWPLYTIGLLLASAVMAVIVSLCYLNNLSRAEPDPLDKVLGKGDHHELKVKVGQFLDNATKWIDKVGTDVKRHLESNATNKELHFFGEGNGNSLSKIVNIIGQVVNKVNQTLNSRNVTSSASMEQGDNRPISIQNKRQVAPPLSRAGFPLYHGSKR